MKAVFALVSALAMATASAIPAGGYTPPKDLPEGGYFVNFDDAGHAVTTRADTGEVVKREDHANTTLAARDSAPFDCSQGCPSQCTGYDLNHNDYGKVQSCMDNFLDNSQGYPYGVWYCRAGNTLLAVCNYETVNYGSDSEINTFNGIMDNQCGSWRSGWVFIQAWQKTYWRTNWVENVCSNIVGDDYNSYRDQIK